MFNLETLEFSKILNLVKKYVSLEDSLERVLSISPLTDQVRIERLLNETEEALNLIINYEKLSFEDMKVKEPLKRIEKYASLNGREFLEVIKLIDASSYAILYRKKVLSLGLSLENLNPYFENIKVVKPLKDKIITIIDENGEVSDNASETLHSVRKEIKTLEARIKDKLNLILRTESSKLTEAVLTIRHGRFVLPVKVEYKNSFKGMIHDESSSGSTVFIEPAQVLDMSNQIENLKVKEQKEIDKLLYDLTLYARNYLIDLYGNLDMITSLDVIYAKAKYADVNMCSKPVITENKINLINARHPLIPYEVCVPNTILFDKYQTIIITGPNTGGKTVLLKTFGLLSAMVQSGILIPVSFGSSTIIFSSIFADIGDEQSIEQSLSTFSSHMTKIINIVNNYKHGSLILLDELGSGTDPKEGASLAISIIEYFKIRGAYIIATTHYPELKAYAYDKEDVCNASVEFDIESLKPTYRLMLGTPGRSNAFLISKRLGLDERIIKRAEDITGTFSTNVDDLIGKLERQAFELNQRIENYDKLINENKSLNKTIIQEKEKFYEEKQNFIRSMELERKKIIANAKDDALTLLEELKKLKNQKEIKAHELADMKHKINDLEGDALAIPKLNNQEIQVGDTVRVIKFNQIGKVVKIDKNGKYEVELGNIYAKFALDEIEYKKVNNSKEEIIKSKKTGSNQINTDVKMELDLRGYRYEDAMVEIDSFIDKCIISNLDHAFIIHGFGTGALRNGVKEYVKHNKLIKSSRFGNESEGGFGVTVVFFR